MIDEAIRRKLHWVQISDPGAIALERFPDFLIVGPQRTGTTWLHAHLRNHPQIFLSEPKELFFFSSLKTPDSPRYRGRELTTYLSYFRHAPHHWAYRMATSLWNYGEPYAPRVRGEATASYAVLDRDIIDEIAALRPDIKVILMVRDPIERAWSHAKKDLVRNAGRRFEEVTEKEFIDFFSTDYQRSCARYVDHYDTWSSALQPGHVFVGHFDDIATRPDDFLLDVMSFLGVRSDRRYISHEVDEPVNPTGSSKIPEAHRRFLEDLLGADARRAEDRFGTSSPKSQVPGPRSNDPDVSRA